MRFVLEIDLTKSDDMKSISDVRFALHEIVDSLEVLDDERTPPRPLEKSITDDSGNPVGWYAFAEGWSVQKDPVQR